MVEIMKMERVRSSWVLIFLTTAATAVAIVEVRGELVENATTSAHQPHRSEELPQANKDAQRSTSNTNHNEIAINSNNNHHGIKGSNVHPNGDGNGSGDGYSWGWGGGGGGSDGGAGWGWGGGGGGGWWKWGCRRGQRSPNNGRRGRGREIDRHGGQRKRVWGKEEEYKMGEYAQCNGRGRCKGMRLNCPLHCSGPCFYDCHHMCKAHCRQPPSP